VFQDPEYVRWANEATVHVLSYDVTPGTEDAEPTVEVVRDGEKVKVLAAYPMFTAVEADLVAREIHAAVEFPLTTPWTGVIGQDGKTVVASVKKGTSKDYRALYEAEQKKLTGPTLPRDAWRKARLLLEESTNAEFDEAWTTAVSKALAAKGVAKDLPEAMAERVRARLDGLDAVAKDRIDALEKVPDPAARAKARAAIKADFKGLPSADALP
jgi:hypothetical protein